MVSLYKLGFWVIDLKCKKVLKLINVQVAFTLLGDFAGDYK